MNAYKKCEKCGAIYPEDYIGTEHDHICNDINFDYNWITSEQANKLISDNKNDIKKYAWKHKEVEKDYYGKNGEAWKHWKISQQLMDLGETETLPIEEQIKIFKETISIIELAKEAGITIKDRGTGYALITCPNPNHPDNNPSCVVWKEINAFKCYSCGASGDVIAFDILLHKRKKQ